jgi:hypothetical protein
MSDTPDTVPAETVFKYKTESNSQYDVAQAQLGCVGLWQKINKVRANVTAVAKDKQVGHGDNQYSVATHEGVNKMLRPLLVEFGLVDFVSLRSKEIVDTTIRYGKNSMPLMQYRGQYDYTVVDIDTGDLINIMVEGHGDDTGDKGPGKATTYALKTGRAKMFSITTGEDEEGRLDETQVVNQEAITVKPDQIDAILQKADELFGDKADSVLARMCDKVFTVTDVKHIPAIHFQQALNLLQNQHDREQGKKDTVGEKL